MVMEFQTSALAMLALGLLSCKISKNLPSSPFTMMSSKTFQLPSGNLFPFGNRFPVSLSDRLSAIVSVLKLFHEKRYKSLFIVGTTEGKRKVKLKANLETDKNTIFSEK
jgi:hypothetical protein